MSHAVRSAFQDKTFALTVILTLAVCIGANTATFAIVNSVLLRPLPVPNANRILVLSNRYPKAGVALSYSSSAGDYYDRLAGVSAFQEQAMFRFTDQTVEIGGVPQRLSGMTTTPSLFRLLQVRPAPGRAFTDAEGEIGNEQEVILSYSLWKQLYGGSPDARGRSLRVSGRAYTVVGVMPAGFNFIRPEVSLWMPLALPAANKTVHHSNNYYNIGLLKPHATLGQVQAQVDAINARNLDRFPEIRDIIVNTGFHTVAEPLEDMLVKSVRRILYLLWGGALFVLLIGAANIANLAFARIAVRRKELATRLALGAGTARIMRQIVSENLVLAVTGGIAGMASGAAAVRALALAGLDTFPRASEVAIDARVILVSIALAAAAGVAIGLIPLTEVFRSSLSGMLQESSRGGSSSRRARRVRRALAGAQVALAFALLFGAALLLASFRRLLDVNPGFETKSILTASTALPPARYAANAPMSDFVLRALDGIRRSPGVAAAAATNVIPFGGNYSDSVVIAEGYAMKPGESIISPRLASVTPGYFETMGIGLVRGRYFDARDDATAPRVVIVDERLARRFWPDRDPTGLRMFQPDNSKNLLHPDEHTRWLRVVGVVRSIRLDDLAGNGGGAGMYYIPYAQSPDRFITFAVKTGRDRDAAVPAIRAAIARADGELPLFDIHTMAERAELTLSSRRTSMLLAIAFGAVALFLSAIGVYGALAYLVAQRDREIGIRMALGGSEAAIVKLILREGAGLIAAGLIAGMAGAAGLSRAFATEIYGVQPLDPALIAAVMLLLGAVALAACITPARRAARVDPASVLNAQ